MKRPSATKLLTLTMILCLATGISFASSDASTSANAFWLWNFLGRLHPMIVHFPIALLLLAAVLELFTLKNFHSPLRAGINVLVFTGSVFAAIAAIMGWLLFRQEELEGNTIDIHQWTGNITALLAISTAAILWYILKNYEYRMALFYRMILFISTIGVSVAGHFGASLTHGDDYLTGTLPWTDDYNPGTTINLASFKADSILSAAQQQELIIQVKGIFAHNCYKCHSSQKVKGELRLDQKHMAFKGGENGAVIIPGKPEESEMTETINLTTQR